VQQNGYLKLPFPPSDSSAATHALTQPRTSAEGARSVLPMRRGRSGSCPSSPTTRRPQGRQWA
jgi:hypothetical protein